MTILGKYVTISVFRCFFLVQIIILGTYLAVDFVEKADDFIEVGLPIKVVINFFLYKIPFIFVQITPIGCLLAVIVVFGFMNRNNELMVLQSSGIGFRIFLKVTVILGIAGSLIVLVISEITIPFLAVKSNGIWLKDVKKKNIITFKNHDVWFRKADLIVHVGQYFPEENRVIDLTINYFDNTFRLIRRIDAKTGSFFKKDKCFLYDVIDQRIDNLTNLYDVVPHKMLIIEIDLDIDDLEKIGRSSKEMSLIEICKSAKRLESQGCDATRYWVDCHEKIASYAVCLLFTMLGVGIVFRNKSSSNISFNITYGICLVFTYWVLHSFCISLGYAGVIIPIISAWIANLIFSCVVACMLFNIE